MKDGWKKCLEEYKLITSRLLLIKVREGTNKIKLMVAYTSIKCPEREIVKLEESR